MKLSTRDLAFMALYLALFAVLDLLANMISIFKMPYGGTLGIGVIALLVCSYHLGVKKAAIVSLSAVLLMFVLGPMYIVHPFQFILDYVLAFSIYCIAVIFNKYWGIIICNALRFICHFISGLIFFKEYAGQTSVFVYSATYNSGFMLPTLILCLFVVPLLCKKFIVNQAHKSQLSCHSGNLKNK